MLAPSLSGYYAEIRAIEDRWFDEHHPKPGEDEPDPRSMGPEGPSPWLLHPNQDKLRSLDAKHGVIHEDPRVYSIRAHISEIDEIHEKWERRFGRVLSPEDRERGREYMRRSARIRDCRARHFPELSRGLYFLDAPEEFSKRKFWAYLKFKSEWIAHLNEHSRSSKARSTDRNNEIVQEAYSWMHKYDVLGAPGLPYEDLKPQQCVDELNRIANLLEREEVPSTPNSDDPGWTPPAPESPKVVTDEDIAKLPERLRKAYASYMGAVHDNPFLETDNYAVSYIYI